MTTEPTYRPGDIAMVKGGHHHPEGALAVYVWAPYAEATPRWVWLDDIRTTRPDEVGPVLGNVADIAAAENQKYEAAMDDYAANTIPGNTWIEENE